MTLLYSYIEDRQQYVNMKYDRSNYLDVTSGVPKGSILGPLLFLFFISDLPNMKPEIENWGFADDFKMIAQNQTELEFGTTHIEMWCKENQVDLTASKCKLLNLKCHTKIARSEWIRCWNWEHEEKNESNTRQKSRGEFEKKNRLSNADENFCRRKIDYNIVSRVYRNYGEIINKQTITNIYRE